MRKIFIVLSLLIVNHSWADEGVDLLNGFTITPGVGLRHLGLDVVRKSDNFTGNISQDVAAKVFFSLSVESPKYRFGKSGWGLSILNQNTFVTLDSQWYQYTNPLPDSPSGERRDVGTEISGRYSYLLPQIFFEAGRPGSGKFRVALGYGLWNAELNGNIKLTANDQPVFSTPTNNISINTTQMAYLFSMSYRTRSQWLYEMTVGGPQFSDSNYNYKVEEVALTIGKTFTF